MPNKNKKTLKERDVLKALNDLEEAVALSKGDAMEDADPEGGLSTEGTPLSNKAPSGKGAPNMDAKKSRHKGDDDDDVDKGMDASSVASSDSSSVDKADADSGSGDASDESGDADSESESSDDDDSESMAMSKSLRQRAEEDEEMHKGLMVAPFLEAMVDQMSSTIDDMNKSFHAHIDRKIEKSMEKQGDFNIRLAKGMVTLGKMMKEIMPLVKSQAEVIKSFGNLPNVPQRKSVLNKSEIAERDGGDGDDDATRENMAKVNRRDTIDWLIDKAEKGEVPAVMVTQYENSGYNPQSLPLPLRKAMMSDLAKAQ